MPQDSFGEFEEEKKLSSESDKKSRLITLLLQVLS